MIEKEFLAQWRKAVGDTFEERVSLTLLSVSSAPTIVSTALITVHVCRATTSLRVIPSPIRLYPFSRTSPRLHSPSSQARASQSFSSRVRAGRRTRSCRSFRTSRSTRRNGTSYCSNTPERSPTPKASGIPHGRSTMHDECLVFVMYNRTIWWDGRRFPTVTSYIDEMLAPKNLTSHYNTRRSEQQGRSITCSCSACWACSPDPYRHRHSPCVRATSSPSCCCSSPSLEAETHRPRPRLR